MTKHIRHQKFFLRVFFAILLIFLAIAAITAMTNRTWVAQQALDLFHLPRVADRLAPNDPALQFAVGNYYFGGSKEYDVDRAETFFRKTLALDFFYPGVHYQLGRTLFIQGDMYAAEREIDEELKLHPDFWRSYYMRALIRGYGGAFFGAARDFEEFLRHKPESWAAHNDLAWVYFQLGEYAKVRDTALDGLNYAPENAWLNNSLGIALMNLGDKEGAKTALERAGRAAEQMTPDGWGRAYPGNDPRVYAAGLAAMRSSIKENLALLNASGTSTPR
ncbi:MAG: hypothetical protein Q7S52_03775 [bacterium]|nr:hypothetical protein [bacterium]